MKNNRVNRLLSLLLALVLCFSLAAPAGAVNAEPSERLRFEKVETDASEFPQDRVVDTVPETPTHAPADVVRVSIVLEEKSTVQAGYSTMAIAQNAEAMAYNDQLQARQQTLEKTISAQALGGKQLDVVWNLTLVGNLISANVPYGSIEAIKAVKGVQDVVLERTYTPCVVSKEETATPPDVHLQRDDRLRRGLGCRLHRRWLPDCRDRHRHGCDPSVL